MKPAFVALVLALARSLLDSGWAADTPVSVVSRAGWPDQLHSDHTLQTLPRASLLHAGRPTVVAVGEGARPVAKPVAAKQAKAPAEDHALPVKTPSP